MRPETPSMLGATLEQVMTQSVADMTIVEALAAGESTTVAAERAAVSRRTVERRLADPDFRGQVEELQQRGWAAAVRKLTAASTKAAEALERMVDDPDVPANVRLRACMFLLEAVSELTVNAELSKRIEALERDTAARRKLRSA
jgi:hypothetical protein